MSKKCVNGVSVKVRHNITLPDEVRGKGEEMAREDLRSFSNLLEWLLEQEWRRRGKNQPKQQNLISEKAA